MVCVIGAHMANIIIKKHLISTLKKATSANFKIEKSTSEYKMFKIINLDFFFLKNPDFLECSWQPKIAI